MNIDLHTHSSCSDGSLSPVELIERACAAGIEVLALTDHDTIAGVSDAAAAAARLRIQLVPGVEISATWRQQSIHIVGLWVDPTSSELRAALEAQAARRRARMRAICTLLTQAGLPGNELLAAVEGCAGLPTRSHLAAALVAGGHVHRAQDAFRKYLGRGRRAHVAADWPPLAETVATIRRAGGVASLAHPARYALSPGSRRRLVAEFAAAGGAALEIITGVQGTRHGGANADLAARFGLCGSLGSDFHDPRLAWNPLGRLAKLPDGIEPVWRDRL